MTQAQINLLINLAILVLAGVSLVLVVAKGELRVRVLRQSPKRDLGFDRRIDALGAGLALAYVGLMLVFIPSEIPAAEIAVGLLPFFFLLLFVVLATSVPDGLRTIGLTTDQPGRALKWALIATIVGLLLSMSSAIGLDALLHWLGQDPPLVVHETLRKLEEEFSLDYLLTVILGAVILAPIFEEIIFRGILQTSLLNLFGDRRWLVIVISSLIFAITHWHVVPPQGLVPLFVIGMVFGYVYERTGSLISAILCHAVFNASNIGILLISIAAGGGEAAG